MSPKIGILPASPDLSHPADRRRIGAALGYLGYHYELAEFDKAYDIVFLTLSADLDLWRTYRDKQQALGNSPKIIFDFCDNIIAGTLVSDVLRGLMYFISGKSKRLHFRYSSLIKEIIRAADVVVVGSEEQRQFIRDLTERVVVIHDHFGAEVGAKKLTLELRDKNSPRLLWEGLSHGNIKIWKGIRRICESILPHLRGISLTFVTDEVCCRVGGRWFCRSTLQRLHSIFRNSRVNVDFTQWTQENFQAEVQLADVGIIWIPDDPVMRMKPENKLLYMWSIGIPVVVTDTPAYRRVMSDCELLEFCVSDDEFPNSLEKLLSSEALRQEYMRKANVYLAKAFGDDYFSRKWAPLLSG